MKDKLQRRRPQRYLFGEMEKDARLGGVGGERKMNQEKLNEIVRLHGLWLRNEEGGVQADLSNATLRGVNLSDANLSCATLRGANLSYANLSYANLCDANLRDANLSEAYLRGVNLSEAYLRGVNLRDANLSCADLSGSIGGPPYYSISWSGHGELGRRLHAVEQDGQLMFSCGCFSGTEEELREYIEEEGGESYAESRLRALEIILELHEEKK